MRLARAIHLDSSDQNIFHNPARTGEWCISGGFEFSNWTEGDLAGKSRQAFANGWLGLETFGRVTLVAVSDVSDAEYETLINSLAHHFQTIYGAPTVDAAKSVAVEEIAFMLDLCEDHATNTLLTVSRDLTEAGVKEQFRKIDTPEAGLEQFAIHGSLED